MNSALWKPNYYLDFECKCVWLYAGSERVRCVLKDTRLGFCHYLQRCKNPKQLLHTLIFPTWHKQSNPALPLNMAARCVSATGARIGEGLRCVLIHTWTPSARPDEAKRRWSSKRVHFCPRRHRKCKSGLSDSLLNPCGSSICTGSCLQGPYGVYKKAQVITMATNKVSSICEEMQLVS